MRNNGKIEIALPKELADKVHELAEPGKENELIAEALKVFFEHQRREALRVELIAGYQAMADESIAIAEAWLPLGQEAWERYANATE